MIFENVTVRRYVNTQNDLYVQAELLEMYDAEKIWAGKNIVFTRYDEQTYNESLKGAAGILYIDEKAEEYYLGKEVYFHLLSDDFFVRSPALVWKKRESLLSAPSNAAVSVKQGEDIAVEGTNFVANTATKSFMFATNPRGYIHVHKEDKNSVTAK
ncbi:MAG: LPS export ABC transporter periplasmic protein LptC [Treponema sp.]